MSWPDRADQLGGAKAFSVRDTIVKHEDVALDRIAKQQGDNVDENPDIERRHYLSPARRRC
ncbi:hypothetical protein ABIF07_000115 [Bradyrhizobium elkanii]|uniref:hypothetical protein n=1 Tax=Bradyrhizobium elkanii TaxID=29448 RepID=UPI0035154798